MIISQGLVIFNNEKNEKNEKIKCNIAKTDDKYCYVSLDDSLSKLKFGETITNKYNDTYGIYRKDGQFIGIDKIQKLFQILFDGDIQIDKIANMSITASKNITIICIIFNFKSVCI